MKNGLNSNKSVVGDYLKDSIPSYLEFLDLTKGELVLTDDDKMLILFDLCNYYGRDFFDSGWLNYTFYSLIQMNECNHIKNKKERKVKREEIIQECIKKGLGSRNKIEMIFSFPISNFLDYSKMTRESYIKNKEMFGDIEILEGYIN